jgi:hypothetical protein
MVIGTDKAAHGVSEQGQEQLLSLLETGFVKGLKQASVWPKEQLLLLTQSGQEHDTRLMCLVLRALYDVGRVACLGVVDTSPSTNEALHQILREVIRAHLHGYFMRRTEALTDIPLRFCSFHIRFLSQTP